MIDGKPLMKIDPWIETYSGVKIEFLNPSLDTINIEDIAHALAHQCRFNGHTKQFYSVAEHSVNCSFLVDKEYQLQALLHDASEAYITDIASPVKQYLSNYKELEKVVMEAIAKKYNFEWPMSKQTSLADLTMLSDEAYLLMSGKGNNYNMWDDIPRPERKFTSLHCWTPLTAKSMFLARFSELQGNKNVSKPPDYLAFRSVWDYADAFRSPRKEVDGGPGHIFPVR